MEKTRKQLSLGRLLLAAGFLFLAGGSAQGQELYSFNRKVVNWGLKVGLNANATMRLYGVRGEEALPSLSFRNRSGCDLTGFFRINLDRFFIQPEIGWSALNKDISFPFPPEQGYPPVADLSLHSQTANVNGLIGYNLTKAGPFVFNVLGGTALCYKYYTRYSVIAGPEAEYDDRNPSYTGYGLLGFSMNISNVHFDIRYAVSLFVPDLQFDEIPNRPDWLAGVVLYKNENLLSFSCGLMF